MNKELKDKWVEALRSGRYQQGKFRLKRPEDNTFCCLGVLCDIMDPSRWTEGQKGCGYKDDHNQIVTFTLGDNLQRKVGLTQDQADRLSQMNDGRHHIEPRFTFNQIADWIEKNI